MKQGTKSAPNNQHKMPYHRYTHHHHTYQVNTLQQPQTTKPTTAATPTTPATPPLTHPAAPVKTGGLGVSEAELDTGPDDDGTAPLDDGDELVRWSPPPSSSPSLIGRQVWRTLEEEDEEVMTWERSTLVAAAAAVSVTGGTEMGWPAWEHWETTTFETAVVLLALQCGIYLHGRVYWDIGNGCT